MILLIHADLFRIFIMEGVITCAVAIVGLLYCTSLHQADMVPVRLQLFDQIPR